MASRASRPTAISDECGLIRANVLAVCGASATRLAGLLAARDAAGWAARFVRAGLPMVEDVVRVGSRPARIGQTTEQGAFQAVGPHRIVLCSMVMHAMM